MFNKTSFHIVLLLLLFTIMPAAAQTSINQEAMFGGRFNYKHTYVGLNTGNLAYRGDIHTPLSGGYKVNYGIELFIARALSHKLEVRVSILQGRTGAHDKFSEDDVTIYYRNLSFVTSITELSFQARYRLFPKVNRPIFGRSFFECFAFSGLGIYYYEPYTQYHDKWLKLQPLGTEGQYLEGSTVKPYKRLQPNIPMGIDLRFKLSPVFTVHLDLGRRFIFTDYLDDVSGVVPDIAALHELNPTAAALSIRSTEMTHLEFPKTTYGSNSVYDTGEARGDLNKRDRYMFYSLGLTIIF